MNARLDVRKAGELSTDANKMVLVFHKAEVVERSSATGTSEISEYSLQAGWAMTTVAE
jgi:hypothetical protein